MTPAEDETIRKAIKLENATPFAWIRDALLAKAHRVIAKHEKGRA